MYLYAKLLMGMVMMPMTAMMIVLITTTKYGFHMSAFKPYSCLNFSKYGLKLGIEIPTTLKKKFQGSTAYWASHGPRKTGTRFFCPFILIVLFYTLKLFCLHPKKDPNMEKLCWTLPC
jgi:hypothetical protein